MKKTRTYWRKRTKGKNARANLSWSETNGLGASGTVRTDNKAGPGANYNTKKGLTISLRGTGLRMELGEGIQKTGRKSKKTDSYDTDYYTEYETDYQQQPTPVQDEQYTMSPRLKQNITLGILIYMAVAIVGKLLGV